MPGSVHPPSIPEIISIRYNMVVNIIGNVIETIFFVYINIINIDKYGIDINKNAKII
jgi:hypothetical protein